MDGASGERRESEGMTWGHTPASLNEWTLAMENSAQASQERRARTLRRRMKILYAWLVCVLVLLGLTLYVISKQL